jgi:hypothetical protein
MAVISKPLVLDVQGPILLTLSVLLMCGMLCRPEEPEGHPQGGLYAMCRAWSLYGKMLGIEPREVIPKMSATCAHALSLGV